MSFFNGGSFGGFFRAPGGGVVEASYDEPTSHIATSYRLAEWATPRINPDYTGATIRIKRSSDSTEQDFTPESNGFIDIDAVETFCGAGDGHIVTWYDQYGSLNLTNATGYKCVSSGTAITTGVSEDANYQFSPNATKGVLCGIADGTTTAYLISDTYSLDTTDGFLMTIASQTASRIVPAAEVAGDPYSPISATQHLFSIGVNSTKQFRNRLYVGGGTEALSTRTTNTSEDIEIGNETFKKLAHQVKSYEVDPATGLETIYGNGWADTETISATAISDLQGGDYASGKVIIGNTFNTSGGGVRSDQFGDIYFTGAVLTKPLPAQDRWLLQEKMRAMMAGPEELLTPTELDALLDDVVLMKDISGSNVTSREGKTFTFAAAAGSLTGTDPYTGLQSVYWSSQNTGNTMISNDAVPPDLTGTLIAMYRPSGTSNSLCAPLSISNGSNTAENDTNVSAYIGVDHGQHAVYTTLPPADDTDTFCGRRHLSGGGTFNYDGVMQIQAKYNNKAGNAPFLEGELLNTTDGTVDSAPTYAWTESTWNGTDGSAPFTLDGPVYNHCADEPVGATSLQDMLKNDATVLHFATFTKSANYNKGDSYATKKTYMLEGTTASYVSQGATLGHRDLSVAINPACCHVDNGTGAKFMSWQGDGGARVPFTGYITAFAWSNTALTKAQAQKVSLNMYKKFVA